MGDHPADDVATEHVQDQWPGLPRSGRCSALGVGGGCAKERTSCNNAFASLHRRHDRDHTDRPGSIAPPGHREVPHDGPLDLAHDSRRAPRHAPRRRGAAGGEGVPDRGALRRESSLWRRLLGRPVSESSRLRHGDWNHEWGDRRRRAFMLPILLGLYSVACERLTRCPSPAKVDVAKRLSQRNCIGGCHGSGNPILGL